MTEKKERKPRGPRVSDAARISALDAQIAKADARLVRLRTERAELVESARAKAQAALDALKDVE